MSSSPTHVTNESPRATAAGADVIRSNKRARIEKSDDYADDSDEDESKQKRGKCARYDVEARVKAADTIVQALEARDAIFNGHQLYGSIISRKTRNHRFQNCPACEESMGNQMAHFGWCMEDPDDPEVMTDDLLEAFDACHETPLDSTTSALRDFQRWLHEFTSF